MIKVAKLQDKVDDAIGKGKGKGKGGGPAAHALARRGGRQLSAEKKPDAGVSGTGESTYLGSVICIYYY